jgi:hypothetical protein
MCVAYADFGLFVLMYTYKHFINKKILITEQQISDVNPLFELAKVTNTLRLKP